MDDINFKFKVLSCNDTPFVIIKIHNGILTTIAIKTTIFPFSYQRTVL